MFKIVNKIMFIINSVFLNLLNFLQISQFVINYN
jgi:hypothetical protein